MIEKQVWSENVLLVDADYLDCTAFDLIVNFERMINRPIPPADLCRWLDCVALDGGVRPGNNAIQALFIHSKTKVGFDHFNPASFSAELDGKAFQDNLGEFTMHSFPVEDMIDADAFFVQALETLVDAEDIKRLMVVGDMECCGDRIKARVSQAKDKDVTLFAMQPIAGGRGFSQEILGYSLMSALGIRSEELK